MPAEYFHPSEYVRDECEARGWTAKDLAAAIGCDIRLATELMQAEMRITRMKAYLLHRAFGTSVELWLNLQAAYDKKPKES